MLFYCLWRNVGTSCRKYFVVVSRHQQTLPLTTLLRKYDVTPLFQDGRREWSILLPVSYLLTSLPSEGQNLRYQRNKFRQHITIHCWDITTFLRKTSAILEFYFRFRSRLFRRQFAVICILLCIRLPNFVQVGAPTAEIWRHIDFSRWQPRPLNTTSGFVFVDVTAFRRSKSIGKPNFVDMPLFTAEIGQLVTFG